MRRIIDNDYLTLTVRLFVGAVFIYAAYYKILEPGDFAKSIWYYHLTPVSLINLVALILPWWEMLAGLFLIFGVFYRGAVWSVLLMNLVFIVALASAAARGLDIECGCFKASQGAGDEAVNTLIRDLGLLLLMLQLLFSRSRRFLVDRRQAIREGRVALSG